MIEKADTLKRALLWLPAKLYELLVRLRVVAYETEYLKAKRLDATVISVGNITLGGSGKTPLVEYLARYLSRESYTVAILTRGYGRQAKGRRVLNDKKPAPTAQASSLTQSGGVAEYGDEPLMLARALPEVPVVIDKQRYEGGQWALQEFGADVLLLDDGYQHLQLARDLNILVLDATDPFGGFEMAPFGRLREPLYGIKRADVILVTRADHPMNQAQILEAVRMFCDVKTPVLYVYSTIAHLRHLATNAVYEASDFQAWNAVVLCAIGNPHAFSEDILKAGINIAEEHFFADHHAFTQTELDRVTEATRKLGADAIITTEKDAVRLEGLQLSEIPIYAARLEIQSEDEVRLKSLLLKTILQKRRQQQ